jgi:flagellar biogenesis protein FliO
MKMLEMEITQTQVQTLARPGWAPWFTIAVDRLKLIWRFATRRIGIKRKPKALSIRESAALGDRRFVSVIQFEHQRFLIGSSPSSVTLLSQLPDEPSISDGSGEEGRNKSGEKN